jgi:hypothetical protein
MKNQFKYAVFMQLKIRTIIIAAVILLNVVLGLIGLDGGRAAQSIGYENLILLSAAAYLGLIVVSVMCIRVMYENTFLSPHCYATLLVPVKRHKILLSRILANLVFDLVSFTIATLGVMWQDYNYLNHYTIGQSTHHVWEYLPWLIAVIVVYYFAIMSAIFFFGAMGHSLFTKTKMSTLLTPLVALAVFYVFNLVDFLLFLPWLGLSWVDLDYTWVVIEMLPIYAIEIPLEANAGLFVFLFTMLARSAAFIAGAVYFLDRRISV